MKFTATIEMMEKGMRWHVAYIPGDVVEALDITGTTRVMGTVNKVPFRLAALSDGNGRYYLTMGKQLRQPARCKLGSLVHIEIDIDPNPDFVEIPEEMEAALDQDEEAMEIFETFTPGVKRSILHYINSAKRVDTRINRALQLCEKMKAGELSIQKKK